MPPFLRPFTIHDNGSYSVVWDATGRIVAQGRREMCEDVMTNGPDSVWIMGDLFSE